MKKIICMFLTVLMSCSLLACGGGKKQNAELLFEQNGISIEFSLEAKGDLIQQITQVSTIDCSSYTEEQLALIEQTITEYNTIYKEIPGVKYSSETNDTSIVETIVMDVSKDEAIQALSEKDLLPIEGKGTVLSFEKTIENLQSQGWILQTNE